MIKLKVNFKSHTETPIMDEGMKDSMERVISLLKERNQYLEKFHFLNEQELINFGAGDFDAVEVFYQTRDKILDLIKCIDGLINEENQRMQTAPVTAEQRSEVEAILFDKDNMVKSILDQDLQLMTYIEKEKSNIIRELRSNSTAKKAVGAYANTERMFDLED